ncbi:IclR family transcriptional regulator [Alcaligenaceae bacterium B3P038]|nr:IclR family transcriptional regulator [Alcaligenaceae bacterium B3P038]
MSTTKETPGAQTMRRSLQVLRALGAHHEEGLTVSEVIAITELERSTAHRLLTCLVEEQFAERDTLSRRYRLGLEAMRLGFATLKRAPLVATYQPILQRLARISEDTVFLLARQGDYTVCLAREDGAFPVKIFSTRVGDIRPLGIGVGGLAILAAAQDDDIARIREQHAPAFFEAGLPPVLMNEVISRTRQRGFSELVDTVTQGVGGVGAVIPDASGPFAAISIAAINPRMASARRAELGELLVATLAGQATR